MKNKWNEIESDMDYRAFERILTGRMTKLRYKTLDGYCRKKSKRYGHCGHEHDCCGCICGERYSFIHKHNRTTITHVITFNY